MERWKAKARMQETPRVVIRGRGMSPTPTPPTEQALVPLRVAKPALVQPVVVPTLGLPTDWRLARATKPLAVAGPAQREWYRRMLSILAALVVGGSMGAAVLYWFPLAHQPVSTSEAISSLPLMFPALTCTMIVSDKVIPRNEIAQRAREEREKGWAPVILPESRLAWGASGTRERAMKLVGIMHQQQKRDVVLREMRVGGKELALRKLGKEQGHRLEVLAKAIQQANSLIEYFSLASSRSLPVAGNRTEPLALPAKLAESQQAFLSVATLSQPYLPVGEGETSARGALRNMVESFGKVTKAARVAKRDRSPAALWEVQENVVRYILAYEILMNHLTQKAP